MASTQTENPVTAVPAEIQLEMADVAAKPTTKLQPSNSSDNVNAAVRDGGKAAHGDNDEMTPSEMKKAQVRRIAGIMRAGADQTMCCGVNYGSQPWHLLAYVPEAYKNDKKQLFDEVMAGITVAFAQVSESVAFAFIAGIGPLLGLHAAWIIGLSLSIFGSRPGMINGATGVRAAVIAPFVSEAERGGPNFLGIGYLFYIVLMISVFQLAAGCLQLAKFVRLVPRPVMIGFVNGLAIILLMGQFFQFLDRPNPNLPLAPNATRVAIADLPYISGTPLGLMFVHIVLVVLMIIFIPKIPKAGQYIPASLSGLLLATFVEHVIIRPSGGKTPTIGEVSTVRGGFPSLFFLDTTYTEATDPLDRIPPLTFEVVKKVTMPAFIAAAAGAVEAVMTMEVVNDLTDTGNESPNMQLIALSIGNFVSGMFGTMGGGATIGLSVINCTSGANGYYRLSGIVAGVMVLLFVLVASPLIELIPTASLVGVMVIVIFSTFDWESVPIVLVSCLPKTARDKLHGLKIGPITISMERKIKRTDALTIVIVTVVTLVQDLFVAVAAGILFTAAAFAWDTGSRARCDAVEVKDEKTGAVVKKIYHMRGPLFFASAQNFVTFFTPNEDPDEVEVHFLESGAEVNDYSGIHALNVVGEKYESLGKRLTVMHLNVLSEKRLYKSRALMKNFAHHKKDDGDGGGGGGGGGGAAAEGKAGEAPGEDITVVMENNELTVDERTDVGSELFHRGTRGKTMVSTMHH